jgi:MFS family permease
MSFMVYYTLGAIVTYFLAANILDRIEVKRGERFEYRNLIFFLLIFGLALLYMFLVNPEQPVPLPGTEAPSSNGGPS